MDQPADSMTNNSSMIPENDADSPQRLNTNDPQTLFRCTRFAVNYLFCGQLDAVNQRMKTPQLKKFRQQLDGTFCYLLLPNMLVTKRSRLGSRQITRRSVSKRHINFV